MKLQISPEYLCNVIGELYDRIESLEIRLGMFGQQNDRKYHVQEAFYTDGYKSSEEEYRYAIDRAAGIEEEE